MNTIAPCPFCGFAEAYVFTMNGHYCVTCSRCSAIGPPVPVPSVSRKKNAKEEAQDEVIFLWNERA